MDALQTEVYQSTTSPIARIATKSSVKLISSSSSIQHGKHIPTSAEIYQSRYVPEAWAPDSRGTYGGDLITQGLNAAWQSVLNRSKQDNDDAKAPTTDGTNFQPHSIHAYFVKAGSTESVMRWEVIKVSDTRNFANRCVLGYQSHSGVLVVTIQASFTRNNDLILKQRQFEHQISQGQNPKSWPLVFKRNPGPMFFKYRDNLHDLNIKTMYYSNHITRAMPKELFEYSEGFNLDTTADQEWGMFVKINDDLHGRVIGESAEHQQEEEGGATAAAAAGAGAVAGPSAGELTRRKYLALTYLSDSFWASTLVKALGLPIGITTAKTVSLDHTLYFHDSNFEIGIRKRKPKRKSGTGKSSSTEDFHESVDDDSNWLYMETQFVSMGNNRMLGIINFYSLENDGKLIATAVQETYGAFPKDVFEKSTQLHKKYNGKVVDKKLLSGGAKL
ncbi:hypothetical protein KGF57_003293 [Candida theae]|uniref:Acyl-CoA thioesterase-like N-terminal HotDog domain-containing protein n=1 Tax=Candida theae TaxID=1198502 RepID=A0AAD5BDL9_9ASCO|nr:uncharacterized protein KGF57_003293 [Candida theae]KAI5957599.1 hypothetical protein KGF57_003293 [Candida theae]